MLACIEYSNLTAKECVCKSKRNQRFEKSSIKTFAKSAEEILILDMGAYTSNELSTRLKRLSQSER